MIAEPPEESRVLEVLLLGLLGFVVGAFGTLVGAGGGFLLVPILLLLYPDRPPDVITAMSLFVVLGNASSGTVAYARQKRIDVRSGLAFAVATLPGAVAGAIVVKSIDRHTFNLVFAVVLAAIGVYLLLPRPVATIREPLRGRGVVSRTLTDRDGTTYVYAYRRWQGLAISAGVGFVSSLLGIGGGIVHVPVMAIVLRFPVHLATATSHMVLALMALETTAVHLADGTLRWDQTLAQAAFMSFGAIVGAQVGARLSNRIHGHHILQALGGALLLVAARLALLAFA